MRRLRQSSARCRALSALGHAHLQLAGWGHAQSRFEVATFDRDASLAGARPFGEPIRILRAVENEIDQVLRAALAKVEAAGGSIEEACPNLANLYQTYVTLRAMFWATLAGRLSEQV